MKNVRYNFGVHRKFSLLIDAIKEGYDYIYHIGYDFIQFYF
jgi:hypothetical protein